MTSPAIILHTPQLGENIGATARVMRNFGLCDLRLVDPRDGWPNPAADTMSAGAFENGVFATVHSSFESAIADRSFVVATTARPRGMQKPVSDLGDALQRLRLAPSTSAVVFGGERAGLPNEAVALCDLILTYPVDGEFPSLNLAQAVGVFAHGWAVAEGGGVPGAFSGAADPPATRDEVLRMFEHFEDELARAGFFFPGVKRPVMVQNLRNAMIRAQWTSQEVRTFRGAVKALSHGRGKARVTRDESEV
ncbi:RNA methyltransferase [bacterium]|nr:RNA methyltransferase [bacterium]